MNPRLLIRFAFFLLALMFMGLGLQHFFGTRVVGTRIGGIYVQPSVFMDHRREIVSARLNGEVRIEREGTGAMIADGRRVRLHVTPPPVQEGEKRAAEPTVVSFVANPRSREPQPLHEIRGGLWGLQEGSVAMIRTYRDREWKVEVLKVCGAPKTRVSKADASKIQEDFENCRSLPPDVPSVPMLAVPGSFSIPEKAELVERILAIPMDEPGIYLAEFCFLTTEERCRDLVAHLEKRIEALQDADPRKRGRYRDAVAEILMLRSELKPHQGSDSPR